MTQKVNFFSDDEFKPRKNKLNGSSKSKQVSIYELDNSDTTTYKPNKKKFKNVDFKRY
jgi:hypothetical protein